MDKIKKEAVIKKLKEKKAYNFKELDSYMQVRVSTNMMNILREAEVHVSFVVRECLLDIAQQLMDGVAEPVQPDFYLLKMYDTKKVKKDIQ